MEQLTVRPEAGLEVPAYPAGRNLAATIDTLATMSLSQPGAPACKHLRPERISPALQWPDRIYPAAAVRLQKYAAAIGLGRCHQFTIGQPDKVAAPEPARRQAKVTTNGFRLIPAEKNVIPLRGDTAVAAAGAVKAQGRLLEERCSGSTHGDRLR